MQISNYFQPLISIVLLVLGLVKVSLQQRGSISNQEVEQLVDNEMMTKKVEDRGDDQLMKDWEQYMKDFSPDQMFSTEILGKEEQSYYEDVQESQDEVIIKGAYFVGARDQKNPTVDFFILDPKRQVVYNRRRKSEGIFKISASIPGQYTFIFSNLKSPKGKDLTFAISNSATPSQIDGLSEKEEAKQQKEEQQYLSGEMDENQQLEYEHLRDLTDSIVKSQLALTSIQIEAKIQGKRLEFSNQRKFIN
eukprot:403348872